MLSAGPVIECVDPSASPPEDPDVCATDTAARRTGGSSAMPKPVGVVVVIVTDGAGRRGDRGRIRQDHGLERNAADWHPTDRTDT